MDPGLTYVFIGTALMGAGAALIGTFAFLRKRALVGDVISHSVLPGICLAFIVYPTKSLPVLLGGAFVTGWLSLHAVDFITRHSKIKSDAANGLVLSIFFGVGITLLTSIQRSGLAAQAGLDSFLFGKAAAISSQDVLLFSIVAVLLLLIVFVFYKEFKLISFDPDFAKASGVPVKKIELLLSSTTVLAVVSGIQAVGVVLMAAMLVTPAVAARYWTDNLKIMLLLGAFFAVFAGLSGAWISYLHVHMPTGPWIVVVLSTVAFISLLMAPRRGLLARTLEQRSYRNKVVRENILKALYKLCIPEESALSDSTSVAAASGLLPSVSTAKLMQVRDFEAGAFRSALRSLQKREEVKMHKNSIELTEKGRLNGSRIVRIHRLWELYLTHYLRVAPDHVHDDAEAMEHLITPEVEAELDKLLKYPSVDPHHRPIPRSDSPPADLTTNNTTS